jgi:hypothetical protein
MNNKDKSDNIVILPYKDAIRNYLIEPEDVIKWLEDENLKEELDVCLNDLGSF